MKKLNEAQAKIHQDLWDELTRAQSRVEDAEKEVNHLIDRKLNDAIATYNMWLEKAEEFAKEVVSEMEDYIEVQGRTHPNELTEDYMEWKSEWDSVDLSPMDDVELIHAGDFYQTHDFGNLDTEPR